MMTTSVCNKKVHPFLCLSNSKDNGTHLDFPFLPLRSISIGGDPQRPTTIPPPAKKDPGGIGFLDEVGGSVDGLMSCTESLGFESSDERAVDDQIEDLGINHDHRRDGLGSFSRRSNCGNYNYNNNNNDDMDKKEKKKFPPPLSSLSQDGKPNFFLHAVRKDGRLELKEVKIDRPETLRASRQDGRLRLHLIRDLEQEEEDDDFDDEDEVIETDEEIIEEEEEEEEKIEEWKFPVTGSGSGEGHRRCYGGGGHGGHNNNNHPYDFHVWRQRCVTTR